MTSATTRARSFSKVRSSVRHDEGRTVRHLALELFAKLRLEQRACLRAELEVEELHQLALVQVPEGVELVVDLAHL